MANGLAGWKQGSEWCPDGFQRQTFRHGTHSHPFYVMDRGEPERPLPSVLLLHEFPGISTELVELAQKLASDFRIVIPSIFGRDGAATAGDSLRQICVRREVHVFARHGVSAAVGWLRDFADEHVARENQTSYGVIGMCFSGNFALALAVDPHVSAVVMAQPSLPVWPCALGLSPQDRHSLQNRTALRVQGYRFSRDRICPAAKLVAAERLLGSNLQSFPLTEPNDRQHSTLTGPSRNEGAIEQVRSFLAERLAI